MVVVLTTIVKIGLYHLKLAFGVWFLSGHKVVWIGKGEEGGSGKSWVKYVQNILYKTLKEMIKRGIFLPRLHGLGILRFPGFRKVIPQKGFWYFSLQNVFCFILFLTASESF